MTEQTNYKMTEEQTNYKGRQKNKQIIQNDRRTNTLHRMTEQTNNIE